MHCWSPFGDSIIPCEQGLWVLAFLLLLLFSHTSWLYFPPLLPVLSCFPFSSIHCFSISLQNRGCFPVILTEQDIIWWIIYKHKPLYEGWKRLEDMEPELAIFCNQDRLLVVGLGHQPTHNLPCLQDVPNLLFVWLLVGWLVWLVGWVLFSKIIQ